MPDFPRRLPRSAIAVTLVIVALAIGLRVAYVYQRALYDEKFIPWSQSDPDVYWRDANWLLDGVWPYDVFYYQPGVTYYYGALLALVGRSLPMLYLAAGALDGVFAGVLIAAGWLLARRVWAGWLAGALYALYPVTVFYSSSLLNDPFGAMLAALFLLLLLWQREGWRTWRSLLMGLCIGGLLVSRSNIAPIALAYVAWLWFSKPSWVAFLRHALLTGAVALALVAPFTLHNWRVSGTFVLTTRSADSLLYIGNNRDSDGTYGATVADSLLDRPASVQLWVDVRLDPLRFVGLLLRKAAIHWDAGEPGSNIDFGQTRAAVPLLQALPALNFVHLAALGLLGMVALWGQDRRLFWALAWVLLWFMASTVAGQALGRLRYPATIPWFILAPYALVALSDALHRRQLGAYLRRHAAPALAIAALLAFPLWALRLDARGIPPVPPKRSYAALPADAVPLNLLFNDELRLVGWRRFPSLWPAADEGGLETGQAYAVELFWQVTRPTALNYAFRIAGVWDGEAYGALDRCVGCASYPPLPTSRWRTDELFGEIVGFKLEATPPAEGVGQATVAVYSTEGGDEANYDYEGRTVIRYRVTQPQDAPWAALQWLAYWPPAALLAPVLPPIALDFGTEGGDRISLRGLEYPATIGAGQALSFSLGWQAQNNVRGDYSLFLHIMDANNQLAAQGDSEPVPNLPTSVWRKGQGYLGVVTLNAPLQAGEYAIYIGLIDQVTGERLPIDAPDFRPQLGTLRVE